MTEIYSVGTIAVTEGSVDFVGTGTGWLPPNAKAGDQVNVAGLMIGIAEITDATHGKFAIPYPGDTGAGLPYAIFKTSSEWGTNRSLSMSTAEMIQLLSTLEVPNTGLRFDALGNFAGRANYDDRPTAFGYLSLNGDGVGGTDPVVFAKLSGGDADWSAAISFRGGVGATGPSGILVNWRHAWVTATAYALKDGVQFGGSSYICLIAHAAGDFATDLAAGRWELTSAKGAPGNDGVLSANEEIVTAASRTITAADNGKIFIADRAGGVTFNFDPVASLGTKWLGMFKNAGAGPLTIDPNGAETIDGVATLMLSTSESAMISGNGALLRSHFRGSAGGKRELLTANRTYYVRADGNDGNTGLVNNAAGALLTPAAAIAAAMALDSNGYTVTIQLQGGVAWTAPIVVSGSMPGFGKLLLLGDVVTPGNVTISTTANTGLALMNGARLSIAGLKFQTITSGDCVLVDDAGSMLTIEGNCDFGASPGNHLHARYAGAIIVSANYTISAGAARHWWTETSAASIKCVGRNITLVGTPAFSASFAEAQILSQIIFAGTTFTGGATGKRFNADSNGVIRSFGGNLNSLPGNVAGTTATGGEYDTLVGGVRELLTGHRTYFVRGDGSDANTGLANTAGGAFLTVAKAAAVCAAIDAAGYQVVVSIGAGTFAENVTLPRVLGASSCVITGASDSTTIVSSLTVAKGAFWSGGGFKLTGASQLTVDDFGAFDLSTSIDFAAATTDQIYVRQAAKFQASVNYKISGGAPRHWRADEGGTIFAFGRTITITGTPAYSGNFAYFLYGSKAIVGGMTFVGSATGSRFYVAQQGGIYTGGGGASYLPGSTAGTTDTASGGIYN